MKKYEIEIPYTHFDEYHEFPVMAIFNSQSGVTFTKGKVYELRPCIFKQSSTCMVNNNNGTEIIFTKDKLYWKLVSEIREEKLNKILHEERNIS